MAAGMVARAGGGTRIADLAGLYKGAPFLAVAFLISGLSLAGVPPLAGFWPKIYLVQAGLEAGEYAIVAGVLVSGFLTLMLVGRIFALVFWREAADGAPAADVASPINNGALMKGALGALAALTFVIGVYSAPIVDMSARAAAELLAPDAYIEAVLGNPAQTAAAGTDSMEVQR